MAECGEIYRGRGRYSYIRERVLCRTYYDSLVRRIPFVTVERLDDGLLGSPSPRGKQREEAEEWYHQNRVLVAHPEPQQRPGGRG